MDIIAIDLATAWITILPSTSKLAPEIRKDLDKKMPGVGRSSGKKLGSSLASAMTKATKVGMVAAGVASGAALVGGFKSAIDQQTAKKVFSGLYGSAKQAESVMKGLRDVAKKSPINYSAYLKAGESLAYAGVKGKDATKTLKNVGLAITAAGGSDEQMGRATDALLKMSNAGKVNLGALQQLSGAGVPILSGLAKHFGVSIEQVNKMATAGKIKLKDVTDVMAKGTGKTFQSMIKAGDEASKSFGNQWKIAKDNISVALGEKLQPLLEKLAPLLAKIAQGAPAAIDKVADAFGRAIDFIRPVFETLSKHKKLFGILALALGGLTLAVGLFNIVLAANPIILIGIALAALVVGVVTAYDHFETFRKIVDTAWAVITVAFQVAWAVIKGVFNAFKTAIEAVGRAVVAGKDFIVAAWNKLGPAFSAVWEWIKTNIFAPIGRFFTTTIPGWVSAGVAKINTGWHKLQAIIMAPYNWIKAHVFTPIGRFFTQIIPGWVRAGVGLIKSHWSVISGVLMAPYTWIKAHVFNPLSHFIRVTIPSAFRKGVSAISNAWDKLKSAAKKPVSFVVNHVINPLARGINKILPGNPVKTIKGFATGGPIRGGGTSTSDSILARLSNNEHILSAREVAGMGGHGRVEKMRAMARRGLPAFAKGGRVMPLKNAPPWTSYPGHTGIDFPVGMGTPVYATEAGRISKAAALNYSYGHHFFEAGKSGFTTIYGHLSRMIAKAGQKVNAGQLIGKSGSTGNSTGPHLHFEVRPGGTPGAAAAYLNGAGMPKGGSGAPSILSQIKGFFTKKMPAFISKAASHGGMFGGGLGGLVKGIGSKLLKKIMQNLTVAKVGASAGIKHFLGFGSGGYDSGGLASSAGYLPKRTVQPERVLSPQQTKAFEKALSGGFANSDTGPLDLSEKSLQRLAEIMLDSSQRVADGTLRSASRSAAGTRQTQGALR